MTEVVGLLMVNHEDDILERTLHQNAQWVDRFYALDGTDPNDYSRNVITSHSKCAGYWTDDQVPSPPFPPRPTDGYRQFLLDRCSEDIGLDHWFLLLHADEWWGMNPRELAERTGPDGFVFELPFFVPRLEDGWDDNTHPLDQLRWRFGPGWPEFRMFRGNPNVEYRPTQHFNTRPMGLVDVVVAPHRILHYPFRSPGVQRERARLHLATQFDLDNYRHILDDDRVLWTADMISEWRRRDCFRDFRKIETASEVMLQCGGG